MYTVINEEWKSHELLHAHMLLGAENQVMHPNISREVISEMFVCMWLPTIKACTENSAISACGPYLDSCK